MQATGTRGMKRYANVSVDEASRWCWVRLLRTLKHTKTLALEPLLKTLGNVKTFRSDMGTEFCNDAMNNLIKELNITREAACIFGYCAHSE